MTINRILSKDFKSNVVWLCLILPLGIPAFFHPGSTLAYRTVLCAFELFFTTVFAFYYLEKDTLFFLPKAGIIMIIVWSVWACLAVYFSEHPVASTVRQWEWFCKVLFSFSLWAYLQNHQNRVRSLHWMIAIGVFLICTGFGVFWSVLPDPAHYDWFLSPPHFVHIRHFGYYLTAGVILCLFLVQSGQENGKKIQTATGFFMLVTFWGFLFWSGSRGGIAASGVGCLFTGLFVRGKKKRFFIILIASVLIGFMMSAFFPVEDARLGLGNALERTGESALTGRDNLWAESLRNVKDSLWFGLGPDAFRFFPVFKNQLIQPHNGLIQGVLEWGIPGTIAFVLLLLTLMTKGCIHLVTQKQANVYPVKLTALALIVAYLVFSVIDGVFYHALPLTLMAYAFAVISLPVIENGVTQSMKSFIPVSRMTIRILATLLIAVLCLQVAVSKSLKTDKIPGPFSAKGRLVRFFPCQTHGLESWVMAWEKTDPRVALDVSIQFARASSPSHAFWRLAAIIAAELGDRDMAEQMATNAIQNCFEQSRDQLIREFQTKGIRVHP